MRKSYWIGAGVLLLAAFVAFGTGVVTRSFRPLPNTDGTVNSEFPNGDKDAGDTLTCDISGLASLVGTEVGTPTSLNVRQFIGGSDSAIVAAATLAIETVSGDDAATEGWAISGDNLTHPGLQTGSGSLRVVASHASVSVDADCTPVSWSYVAQAPVTPSDWDYNANPDGLDNGSGTGDWAGFQSVTLQADDATVISNGYLQLTCGASTFAGISSHHAEPSFTAGVEYDLTATVASGTNWTGAVLKINDGTAVAIPVTAGAHDLTAVAGSGSNALVIHANGGCTTGQVLRLTSITLDAVADVFNFQQSSYSGLETDSSIAYCATRTLPTNSAATLDIDITTGGSLATNNDAQLSWLANEGGAKCGSIDPSNDGTVILTASSPSVGTLGSQTTTTITISPVSGAITYPRIGTLTLQMEFDTEAFQHPTQIAKAALRHVVVLNGWPEVQSWRGVSNEAIAAAIKAASTVGTRVYMYVDPEGVHKANIYLTHKAKIENQNWYLYASGTSGTPIDSYYDPTKYAINLTSAVPQDGSGLQSPQWFASHTASWVHNGGEGNTAAPSIDGNFYDNILHTVRRSGDWNRNSNTSDDSNAATDTAYRQGLAAMADYYLANNPTKTITGNLAECPAVSSIQAETPEYYEKFHGGLIEHAIVRGSGFSPDAFLPFATLLARLQGCEDDSFIDPTLGLVGSYPESGTAFLGSDWMQQFRYAFAATTVGTNMTFYWGRDYLHKNELDYYTEYGSLGEYGGSNLGTATDARQSSPIASNCAYRRRFSNGIVVVWPNGCTQAVTLGATYYALSGTGSAWLTPGQAVTSVTPPSGRNGIFLRSTAP